MEFAVKSFRIYLSLMTITCLVKMHAIFFQSIGKSVRSVMASLVRDILCFTPAALILPSIMENRNPGQGINGILIAAPFSDVVAIIVIVILVVSFFKELEKEKSEIHEFTAETDSVIKPSVPGVIITIAREHGSGGKQIGKMVAESLGIPFYYKEMTALAAQESGLDKEFISTLNTNSPSVLHELYLSTNVVQQAVVAQEQIIRKIADQGTCVIVGRAADYVLRDYENVVRVFIHGPKEFRVNKIMEMYGDSHEDALANVKHSDHARSAYYRSITGQNWTDPHNYDLCIDASCGREKCVEIIMNYQKTLTNTHL